LIFNLQFSELLAVFNLFWRKGLALENTSEFKKSIDYFYKAIRQFKKCSQKLQKQIDINPYPEHAEYTKNQKLKNGPLLCFIQ